MCPTIHAIAVTGSSPPALRRNQADETPIRHRRWHGVVDSPALPCWTTPEQYLSACYVAATSDEGKRQRRRLGWISVSKLMRVAAEDAQRADRLTGRNVQTSHQTAARNMTAAGTVTSASTVKRARQVFERLGLAGTVEEGRHLSEIERIDARTRHGGHQITIASTRHLLVPREYATAEQDIPPDHLPTLLSFLDLLTFRRTHQSRKKRPVKPAHSKQSKRGKSRTAPRNLATQKLAAGLKDRLPWLRDHTCHIGSICDILTNAGIDPTVWNTHNLLTELDAQRRELSWDTPTTVTSPLGWLRHLLTAITAALTERRRADKARKASEHAQRLHSALTAGERYNEQLAASATQQRTNNTGAAKAREALKTHRQKAARELSIAV